MITDEQKQALELFNRLSKIYELAEIEMYSNGKIEISVHYVEDLKLFKKLTGVKNLVKRNFLNNTSQYAHGHLTNNLEVTAFAANRVFVGCKVVETEENVLVPAQEEHVETVVHREIVCGKAAR